MSIAYVASNTVSGSTSITMPASIDANDLLLVQATHSPFLAVDNGADPPGDFPVPPSGWTKLVQSSQLMTGAGYGQSHQTIYYRVADGSEDSTSVTFPTGSGERIGVLQYRGVDPSTPIEDYETDWGSDQSGRPATVNGPAVSPSAASSLIVAFLCNYSSTAYSAAGQAYFLDTGEMLSKRYQDAGGSANSILAADALRWGAGSGGWAVGSVPIGSPGVSPSEIAAGTGAIDWVPDPGGRRTFVTLALKAA